jgi:hypothetical protein
VKPPASIPAAAFLLFLALACLPVVVVAGPLTTSAYCNGSQVVVAWSWYEDPMQPTGDPEWTGYDVYRRPMANCGTWVRVNATPFTRTMGASEAFDLTDTPPTAQGWTYEVRLVAADRSPAPFPEGITWDPAWQLAYAACPETEVPIVRGTVSDTWGWTLTIVPCEASCWPFVYVMDYEGMLALQEYVGQVVQVYGTISCGNMEGCSLDWIDHFVPTTCDSPVPVRRSTWGDVKALYR